MWMLVAAAAAALVTQACPPAAPGQPAPADANPDWAEKPDPYAIWWAYPPEAVKNNMPGYVLLSCVANEAGSLQDCTVINETPPTYGFGDAALGLAKDFKFKPALACGKSIKSEVRIPLRFKLDGYLGGDEAAGPQKPISPNAIKLAERVINDLGLPDALDRMSQDEMARSLYAPGATPTVEERKALVEAAQETWAIARPKVMAALIRGYATVYTEQELEQLAAFLESPLGRKFAGGDGKVASVLAEVFAGLEPMMMAEFRRRYCAKLGTCQLS